MFSNKSILLTVFPLLTSLRVLNLVKQFLGGLVAGLVGLGQLRTQVLKSKSV
jgi:hypothetical protein